METIRSSNKHIGVKNIFEDHWEKYLKKHINDVHDHQVDEVEKMLACRDPKKLGYHKYACLDHPDKYVIVPHSCKSRFCNVCGVLATDKWMNESMEYFPDCGYFHLVFTVPDYLWYFFASHDKNLLGSLFSSANEAVMGWFKNRGITPAAIAVLHTFGKKINYNTHIHMIVSAGGLKIVKPKKPRIDPRVKNKARDIIKTKEENSNNQEKIKSYVWKNVPKLPWSVIRKRWKAILMKSLEEHIDHYLEDAISKKQWYFWMSKALDGPLFACHYIGRYSKRPPMAETRITSYDGNFVTFYYEERINEHHKEKRYITLTAEDFIGRLIEHIPLPRFRMVRHYGILSNAKKGELLPPAFALLGQVPKKQPRGLSWRERQKAYLHDDPLLCPICKKEMVLTELAFWSKVNDSLYIKHMNMELELDIQTKGALCPILIFDPIFARF